MTTPSTGPSRGIFLDEPTASHEPNEADFAELFHDEFMPIIRQLGERARGVAELIDDEDSATREAVWQGLSGLGALELGVPDEGADGLPRLRPVAPLTELMGRALYQSPYFDTLIAADMIVTCGPDLHEELLGAIAAGDLTVAAAVREEGQADPSRPGPIDIDLQSGRVHGTRRFVAFAPDVDYLLVVGDAGPGSGDLTATLVPTGQPGVLVRRHDDIGRGDLYTVTFDGACVLSGCVDLRLPGDRQAVWQTVLARARLRHASYLVGLCLGALELSASYARRRQIFGQPLAKLQGPAFRLAELTARTEAVRTLVRQTCAAADSDADVALPACQAVLLAGELATEVGAETIQIHGSYGLTASCHAQRFYRRAIVDGVMFGTGRQLRRQAFDLWTSQRQRDDKEHTG